MNAPNSQVPELKTHSFKVREAERDWSRLSPPGRWQAQLHSVFTRCLNLTDAHGKLIALMSAEGFRAPGAAILELPAGSNFEAYGWSPGERLSLSLELSSAQYFDSRLQAGLKAPFEVRRLQRNITLLPAGVQTGCPQAEERFMALCAAVREAQPWELQRRALEGLLGLGPGLTPSGDDFILGLLAALQAGSIILGTGFALLRLLPPWLAGCRGRTPFISWSYLDYAAAGRFSGPVLDLIAALVYRGEKEIAAGIANLSKFGASSGRDILFGIKQGFALLDA